MWRPHIEKAGNAGVAFFEFDHTTQGAEGNDHVAVHDGINPTARNITISFGHPGLSRLSKISRIFGAQRPDPLWTN